MVAASYLEKKSEDLAKQGIAFESEVRLPSGLNISNPDLICVLGNLLDNAQEACQRTPEPTIILKAAYQKPYCSISCSNTAVEPGKGSAKRRIPELERGVGLTILRDVAKRYDGEFRTEWENGWFKANMILKDKESEIC